MKRRLTIAAMTAALLATTGLARAEGELNIFNWGNYTAPDLIKKFEETYKVKVTVTDYDSNDTALGKIRQGGHGYDIVVPSASYVQIWVEEGLLLESNPNQMENFKNVDPRWVDVEFDPGRKYTVPWQWGSTGVSVDTAVYKAFADEKKGTWKPGPQVLGLAEDGVDYSYDDDNRALITPEMKARLDQAKADIIAGKIKVTEYKAE